MVKQDGQHEQDPPELIWYWHSGDTADRDIPFLLQALGDSIGDGPSGAQNHEILVQKPTIALRYLRPYQSGHELNFDIVGDLPPEN